MFTQAHKEFIFEGNAPFAACHASHLTLLPDGGILAVWFGGSREGADDVAIWSSRRGAAGWSASVQLAAAEGLPHWNPVLFTKPDGGILLFYKVGRQIQEWFTRIIVSTDQGATWSAPQALVLGDRGGRGPVRNKLIVLADGAWLAPASTEQGIWNAFVDISYDAGQTWTKSAAIAINGLDEAPLASVHSDIPVSAQSFRGRGVIQPTLWESAPGKVHAFLRSTEGRIYRSDSDDAGQTWSDAYPTSLPNNNSGIDLVTLANGALVLCYNPVGLNWGPRTPLVLAVSDDQGQTWGREYVLEDAPGEYSYPAIVAAQNQIYVTYTWNRLRIACWQIRLMP